MNSALNQHLWSHRSSRYMNDYKAVLFKRFSEALNQHFNDWHIDTILKYIPENTPLKILDAGCGYGRISKALLTKNRQLEITGIDISENFVEEFILNTGCKAFAISLEKLNEKFGKFDMLICVTVLMYEEKDRIEICLKKMASLLKENGILILIEPLRSGCLFSDAFGLFSLIRKRNKNEICFKSKQLKYQLHNIINASIDEYRMPATTIFILPLHLLSLILHKKIMTGVLKIFRKLDLWLYHTKLPSMHAAFIVKKLY